MMIMVMEEEEEKIRTVTMMVSTRKNQAAYGNDHGERGEVKRTYPTPGGKKKEMHIR